MLVCNLLWLLLSLAIHILCSWRDTTLMWRWSLSHDLCWLLRGGGLYHGLLLGLHGLLWLDHLLHHGLLWLLVDLLLWLLGDLLGLLVDRLAWLSGHLLSLLLVHLLLLGVLGLLLAAMVDDLCMLLDLLAHHLLWLLGLWHLLLLLLLLLHHLTILNVGLRLGLLHDCRLGLMVDRLLDSHLHGTLGGGRLGLVLRLDWLLVHLLLRLHLLISLHLLIHRLCILHVLLWLLHLLLTDLLSVLSHHLSHGLLRV